MSFDLTRLYDWVSRRGTYPGQKKIVLMEKNFLPPPKKSICYQQTKPIRV